MPALAQSRPKAPPPVRDLRPWSEVVEEYRQRVGEPMTEARAKRIARKALGKLSRLLRSTAAELLPQ
jgi:hypothetical protein